MSGYTTVSSVYQTANFSTTSTAAHYCPRCILKVVRRLANQHCTTEHGECQHCGRRYSRRIHWRKRRIHEWKAVT